MIDTRVNRTGPDTGADPRGPLEGEKAKGAKTGKKKGR